jgi:hypothetical protein
MVAAGLAMILLSAGCGDQKVPDPPIEKNDLLVDIFRNMRGKKHDIATSRLAKLKAVYPKNINIDELKEIEYDNMFIKKIQSSVDNNDLNAAERYLNRALDEQKLHVALLDLRKELSCLKALQNAVNTMKAPDSSDSLNVAIAQLEDIIKEYPQAESLEGLVKEEKKLSARMDAWEQRRAMFSLMAEYKNEKSNSQSEIATIISAQLKAQNINDSDPYTELIKDKK